jgi:hypothetical protein
VSESTELEALRELIETALIKAINIGREIEREDIKQAVTDRLHLLSLAAIKLAKGKS